MMKEPNVDVKKSAAKKKRKAIFHSVHITISVVLAAMVALMFLTPIILTITNSFMSASEISANYGSVFAKSEKGGKIFIAEKVNLKFIPDIVSGSQYVTVLFKSPDYLFKFWNSVILVVPILVFQLFVAMLAAYGFARYRGRLREIIFFGYVILTLMPYQVTLVPNFLVANWFGLIDTRWAIWLPGIFSPFAVYLLTKYMRKIPTSFIEAAKIDGAGEWQIFTKVCAPMCKGAVCSVAILIFIDYWNMVEQPVIMLTNQDMHPLSVFLSKINAGEIGLAFAVATIYMIPSLLIFLYGEDYLVEGISFQSGIKG